MENNQTPNEIQKDSTETVLERLNTITFYINQSRAVGDLWNMCEGITCYFKEIVTELEKDEAKIWERIDIVKRKLTPPNDQEINKNWILNEIDKIDIELRKLAKLHGFLTTKKTELIEWGLM